MAEQPLPFGQKPEPAAPGALTARDLKLLETLLSDPTQYPDIFKGWITRWIEANPPMLPISQIFGYETDSISVRVTRTADQTGFSGGVRANVVWQTTRWNEGAMWDSDDPAKITIRVPGKYLALLQIESQVDSMQAEIWKNNTSREAAGSMTVGTVQTVLDLVAGDYLEAKVVPNSSSSEINKEEAHTPEFSVTRVGP